MAGPDIWDGRYECMRWSSLFQGIKPLCFQQSRWWASHPSAKYELVSWDDEIHNVFKKNVANHQPDNSMMIYDCDGHHSQTSHYWHELAIHVSKGIRGVPLSSDTAYTCTLDHGIL